MLLLLLHNMVLPNNRSHCSTIKVVKGHKACKLLLLTTNIIMIGCDKTILSQSNMFEKLMPVIDMEDILTYPCLHYTWDYLMTGIGCFIKHIVMENGGYSIQNFTQLSYNYVFTVGYKVCFFNTIIFWAVCGAICFSVYFNMIFGCLSTLPRCPLVTLSSSILRNWLVLRYFSTLPRCPLVTSPFTFQRNLLVLRCHSTPTGCALVAFEMNWLVLIKTLVLLNELIGK